jgi:transposase
MNKLNVSLQHSIITLWNNGWSYRRIARELDLRRETVSKYVRRHQEDSKPAKVPTGSEAVAEPKPDKVPAGSSEAESLGKVPAVSALRSRSQCEPWREFIEQGLRVGLSAQRVYQDLVSEHQFKGGYDTVKRFVRRLQASAEAPFCRMEVEPGLEAQVDFGLGAWVVQAGKRKRPNLFRMVLSHSRKGYSEVVWRQTTENFIRCLENSFRYYGGVPGTLVIDNLRAAVGALEETTRTFRRTVPTMPLRW